MIKKSEITVCICENCANIWIPKQVGIIPKACPDPTCHSTHWNDKGEITQKEYYTRTKIPTDISMRIKRLEEIKNTVTPEIAKNIQEEIEILKKEYGIITIPKFMLDQLEHMENCFKEVEETYEKTEIRKEINKFKEGLGIKDEMISIQKTPQYVLDTIAKFEHNVKTFEREIKELEESSRSEDVEKIKTKKQSSHNLRKEIDSLKRRYNIQTAQKYIGTDTKANITIILEQIKNNLSDIDYVTKLISELDTQLLCNKLVRNDITDMIKNIDLENILLIEYEKKKESI